MHQLNLYDYSKRYYESAVGRFISIDPLAEMYYSWSPYVYVGNNPLRRTDPTGMYWGDFMNKDGLIIGNDGIEDGRLYAIKTTENTYDNYETTFDGIYKNQKKATEKFIKENSGNTEAFKNNSIAYDNSVEIEKDVAVRQAMMDEISKDNGNGGTGDNQNREFGGNIINGKAVHAPPGDVSNPLYDEKATITLLSGSSSYHSHSSGTAIVSTKKSSNSLGASVTIGGSTTKAYFWQAPSGLDISTAGSNIHYVFGRRDGYVYIHNSCGVVAKFPSKYFVNPKK